MSVASAIRAVDPAASPAPNSKTNITALISSTVIRTRRWSACRVRRSSSLPFVEQTLANALHRRIRRGMLRIGSVPDRRVRFEHGCVPASLQAARTRDNLFYVKESSNPSPATEKDPHEVRDKSSVVTSDVPGEPVAASLGAGEALLALNRQLFGRIV